MYSNKCTPSKRVYGWIHFLLNRSAIISALPHAMQLKRASFYSILWELFTTIIMQNKKNFEAISIKIPVYSLGGLSNLAEISNHSKQIPLESPSQNQQNGASLSFIACSSAEITAGKVSAGMYSNKRAPQVKAHNTQSNCKRYAAQTSVVLPIFWQLFTNIIMQNKNFVMVSNL